VSEVFFLQNFELCFYSTQVSLKPKLSSTKVDLQPLFLLKLDWLETQGASQTSMEGPVSAQLGRRKTHRNQTKFYENYVV